MPSQSSFSDTIRRALRDRFLTPSASDDVARLPFAGDHIERYMVMRERWRYYRSRQRSPLVIRRDQKDTNVIENYSRQIINDSVWFLLGDGNLSFEIGEVEAADEPAEEAILSEFWRPSPRWNPPAFLERVGQSGAISGQPFIRLYTDPERDRIKLVELDAAMMDVKTQDANIDEVYEYAQFWYSDGDDKWRRQRIILQDDGAGWDIIQERYEGSDWISDGEAAVDWDFEFPPIFTAQNLPLAHSFWGLSDIEEAALNDSINELTTDMRKILHYYASPTTVAKGISRAQMKRDMIRTETGAILPLPSMESDIFNLEMQSDLKASQDMRRALIDTYQGVTDSVRLDPDFSSFGQLSGFAIQLLYMPLLAKTARKRNTYGAMLAQVNDAILRLRGIQEPEPVKTIWPSALPTNRMEMAKIAQIVASFGNIEGALRFAGFSPDEIQDIIAEMGRLELVTQSETPVMADRTEPEDEPENDDE